MADIQVNAKTFVKLVKKMRKAQQEYYRYFYRADLLVAKRLEREVDVYATALAIKLDIDNEE